MKSFALINSKGGVGKTTLAVNMAVSLANRLKSDKKPNKVLLIDMDPNGSASRYLLGASFYKTAILQMRKYPTLGYLLKEAIRGNHPRILVTDLITEETESRGPIFGRYRATESDPFQFSSHLEPREFFWDTLHLLPSSPELREIVDAYSNKPQIPFGEGNIPRASLLSEVLSEIRSAYDFIILDTPPGQGLLTLNAISFAHNLIVPVIPEMLSASTLLDFLSHLKDTKHSLSQDEISVVSVIPTLYTQKYQIYGSILQNLKDELSLNLERDQKSILKRPFYFADRGFQKSSYLLELQSQGRPLLDCQKEEPIRKRLESIVDKILPLL